MKRIVPIFFVFTLTLLAAAGERLPTGMLAHVSAKSLTAALVNLDALATACVKDTPAAQQYQAGMLPMMMGAFSPFPQNAWDAKAEIHAVAAMAQPMNPQPVLILKTPGIAAFKKAMADGGAKMSGDDKKMSAPLAKLGGTWYFADAGGGRVACSPNEAARDFVVKALASGWSPKHAGEADLAINLDLKNILAAFKPIFDGYMGQAKQALAAKGDAKGAANSDNPLEPVLARVAAKALAAFESEAPALNNFGIDLSFSGDRLKLAFSLSGDKGSGIDNMRAVYAGGEQPKYALANSLPKETVLVDTMADLSKYPDGWVKFYEETLRDVGGAVMPAKANELAALPRQFLALGIKDYTAGSYLVDDRPVVAFYFEHSKAKGVQDFIPVALKLAQEFLGNLNKMNGGDKAQAIAIDYQPAAGKLGDVPYQRITFRVTPVGGGKPVAYDVMFALGGKVVAGVYGQVNERDLHYAINNYRRPSGGFVNSEPAKKSLADIGNRRVKFTELRPLDTLVNFYVGQAALMGTDPKAARAAVAELRASPACLALGAGATDKQLTFECVVPSEVVGDFIRNSAVLSRLGETIGSAGGGSSSYQDDADATDEAAEAESEQPMNDASDSEAVPEAAPLQLSKTSYGPDDDVEVTVSGVSEEMDRAKAFVAIYKAGAPHSEFGQYFYVPEGESLVTFNNPDAGEYEVRLYGKDGGYSDATLIAKTPFTSVDDGESVTLMLNKHEYRAGNSLAATLRGVGKRMRDNKAFVAIYKAGSPQSDYIAYTYVTQKNATMRFEVPKENGEYEVRFHKSEKNYSDATMLIAVPFSVTGNAK